MTAEKIPSWIEKLLLPKLSEMSGDIKAINARIDSLESNVDTRISALESNMNIQIGALETKMDTRIGALESNMNLQISTLESNMNTRIGSLEAQIVSLRNEMNSKFAGVGYRFDAINTQLESLDKRIPVIEKITVLELKIADLEKRLAAA